MRKSPEWGEFVRAFNGIAGHRHRYEVWRDFITLSGLMVQNSMRQFMPPERFQVLEDEFLAIEKRYSEENRTEFARLFASLVRLLEVEPYDVLGQLYMELDLGNTNTGQFFTPPELSELMAGIIYGDELKELKKPFVTLQEPACGAGGMILAFVKVMLSHGHNPLHRLWVQAIDVDRTAALMCYIQMSLWGIPGEVVVGNSLSLEVREVFYTPAHYLGLWSMRLRRHWAEQANAPLHTPEAPEPAPTVIQETRDQAQAMAVVDGPPDRQEPPSSNQPTAHPSAPRQFDFGF